MFFCLKGWWLRGLYEDSNVEHDDNDMESFKKPLRWEVHEKLKDQNGVSLLFYSVMSNNVGIVRDVLKELSIADLKIKEFYRIKIGE